jgi:glycosyltransferase involved in cell wall biosynthesis
MLAAAFVDRGVHVGGRCAGTAGGADINGERRATATAEVPRPGPRHCMPLISIDTSHFGVRSRAERSPWIVLRASAAARASLPAAIAAAVDEIAVEPDPAPPPDAGAAWLRWRAGERLLAGTASHIRGAFRLPARRFFVPVHFDYGPEWELIGLEPRWFTAAPDGQAREDAVDLRVRIGAGAGEPEAAAAEPWQELSAALRREAAQPGAGIAALATLAQRPGLHAVLHSLCLRNLAVALLRGGNLATAETLLQQAREAHPGYRELDYLTARLLVAAGRGGEAVAALQRATRPAPKDKDAEARVYVGSGGEGGYRAHALLALLAEATGRQQVTIHHFLSGARATPAYAPAVAGLLRQRVPRAMWSAASGELTRLARREPVYQGAVFDWLLAHRDFEAARAALHTWPIAAEDADALRARLERLAPLYRPSLRGAAPAGVILRGPFGMHASTARINRYLAAGLAADAALDVALEPTLPAEEPAASIAWPPRWAAALGRQPQRLDLTIHHGWPPEFLRPPAGKLAVILPWEFGAAPRAWAREQRQADEIWVPSAFVRDVLARAGLDRARLQIIPNGVDLDVYAPEGERYRPAQARGVEFLFVGGAIQRKGLDLLLAAWRRAFRRDDEVSLVIKDLGAKSFYRHLNLRRDIEAAAADAAAAPIVYVADEWPDAQLPRLFRGCDVLVLPYRGEGFGMPLAEAMACGKPVIATDAGPAPEFCPREAGWFVPAREVEVPRALWPPEPMTGPMTWFEPAVDALAEALRAAAASEEERRRRGAIGARRTRAELGWPAVVARYRVRIAALLGRDAGANEAVA